VDAPEGGTGGRRDSHRVRVSFAERYGPWGLVVGASQGIGAASARLLAERGLDLVLVALPEDPLDDVVAEVERAGRACVTITGDVGDLATIDAITDACSTREVGLAVINAAAAAQGAVLELDEEVLLAQVRVNCEAAVRLVRRLLPPMVDRGRGGLVLTSSMSSLVAAPWIATYAATKAFLLRFGESLAEELRGTGVDVTVLVPGAVDTPRFRASLEGRPGFGVERGAAGSARRSARSSGVPVTRTSVPSGWPGGCRTPARSRP
jgi:uncharacterized protein